LPDLKIEHAAFTVADPETVAAWYVENLGMRVVRRVGDPARTHFLADAAGVALIEIYNNALSPPPDYPAMHPLQLHIAFVADEPSAAAASLLAAGATWFEEKRLDDGSHLVMLRDPWGLPIQLCKRGTPLLPGGA
jgi:glyoxylase I family protein